MTFHIASARTVLWIGTAAAAPLPLAQTSSAASSLTRDQAPPDENGLTGLPRDLRRQTVNYLTKAAAGSVVVDIAQAFLYYVLGDGTAIRYGIGCRP
jgi:lipoprotein-anchoring transpeptidase ErfK/SrfK